MNALENSQIRLLMDLPLGVINHGMSLSVQTNFEKNDVCSSVE
jgi:hypothetical protein